MIHEESEDFEGESDNMANGIDEGSVENVHSSDDELPDPDPDEELEVDDDDLIETVRECRDPNEGDESEIDNGESFGDDISSLS